MRSAPGCRALLRVDANGDVHAIPLQHGVLEARQADDTDNPKNKSRYACACANSPVHGTAIRWVGA